MSVPDSSGQLQMGVGAAPLAAIQASAPPAGAQDVLGVAGLGDAVAEHHVRVLATVLAGFRWPERGSFEKLRRGQQAACLEAARVALTRLQAEA